MDQRVLQEVEDVALQTHGLRNLHREDWPLTDVEFRFRAVYCCGYVLSVRRTSGVWGWTVHELREPVQGYRLIDEGIGPEAERLWEDVQRLGVMELTAVVERRNVICVGCGYRVIQLRIDGGYIAAASPMDGHASLTEDFPHDRIIDPVQERVSNFIELYVDWPPYPDQDD